MPDSKRIVITGVSRGLGRAMAEQFLAGGHTVFGCARDERALQAWRERTEAPHDWQAVDVRDDAAVAAWARKVLTEGGPPDLLVNNAAMCNELAPLWKVPADEFDRIIDINIKGVAHVVRHFLPAMIERGSGVVVNFSSGWGRSVSPQVAPYCATKWAIEGLTRALAQELPQGLAAVPLSPGVIDTDMLRVCFGDEAAEYPKPERWVRQAVPFLLQLGPKDNGKSLTVPS